MLEIALRGVLPPLVLIVAALVATGGGRRPFLVPVALAAGVFAAYVFLEEWPVPGSFEESLDAKAALIWMVAATGIVALVPWPWAVRTVGVVLLALAARFVLGGVFGFPESHPWAGWEATESITHWGIGAAVWATYWLLAERRNTERASSLHWFVLSGTAGTAAFVLVQGGVASLAQLSGALAVGLLAVAFTTMARSDLAVDTRAALVMATTVCGTLTVGRYLAETDTLAAALVVALPLTLVLADRPGLADKPGRRWLVTCSAFVVLAGAAALRAWSEAPAPYY